MVVDELADVFDPFHPVDDEGLFSPHCLEGGARMQCPAKLLDRNI